jgi:hypothetical protein
MIKSSIKCKLKSSVDYQESDIISKYSAMLLPRGATSTGTYAGILKKMKNPSIRCTPRIERL